MFVYLPVTFSTAD